MKRILNSLRKDDGYEAIGTWVAIAVAFLFAIACLITAAVIHHNQPRTSYTAICGDMKTYTRISIDRCEDSKLGAEWLYVEDGDRLPKMGEDASNASTRPQGVYDVRHAKR
ncbi:hypothetical protein ACWGJ9_08110 [Curtobacterium citreum]